MSSLKSNEAFSVLFRSPVRQFNCIARHLSREWVGEEGTLPANPSDLQIVKWNPSIYCIPREYGFPGSATCRREKKSRFAGILHPIALLLSNGRGSKFVAYSYGGATATRLMHLYLPRAPSHIHPGGFPIYMFDLNWQVFHVPSSLVVSLRCMSVFCTLEHSKVTLPGPLFFVRTSEIHYCALSRCVASEGMSMGKLNDCLCRMSREVLRHIRWDTVGFTEGWLGS